MRCRSILSFHVCCGVLPSLHERGREQDHPDSSVLINEKFSQARASFSVALCCGYLLNTNRKSVFNL